MRAFTGWDVGQAGKPVALLLAAMVVGNAGCRFDVERSYGDATLDDADVLGWQPPDVRDDLGAPGEPLGVPNDGALLGDATSDDVGPSSVTRDALGTPADGWVDGAPDGALDGALDAARDAAQDGASDGRGDARSDARVDAPRDAPADVRGDARGDGPAGDVRVDAPRDVRRDLGAQHARVTCARDMRT